MLPMAEPFFLPIFSANLLWDDVFTLIISFTILPKIIVHHFLSRFIICIVSSFVVYVNTFLVILFVFHGGLRHLGRGRRDVKRPPPPSRFIGGGFSLLYIAIKNSVFLLNI
jgi:fumarate reductase subunit D